ncbi:MAG: anthranilate synthase component I family protein [Planctomycetota bacterium]
MSPLTPGLVVTPFQAGVDLPRLLRALADRPGLAALDSAGGAPRRFSLVAFDPLPEALVGPLPRSVEGLREYVARLAPKAAGGASVDAVPGPFAGGFIGALAYELGVVGEDLALPAPAWEDAPIVGGLYTDFVVIEHPGPAAPAGAGDRAWLVLGDFESAPAEVAGHRPSVAARRSALERALAEAPEVGDSRLPAVRARGPLRRVTPPAEHRRRVQAAQAEIGRGNIYQANIAHRYEREVEGHVVALYLRLRALSPTPYMGLLRWPAALGRPAGALASASPELLLEVDVEGAQRTARTRPIKGTAPRSADQAVDATQRAALLASAKDRAELAMIVDLERNDLARVAAPGSVVVAGFPSLETYPNVHHLVADVRATLRADVDSVAALASLFPGGSITGAPKVASMRVIAGLEGEGRGFFTGALGCLDVRGFARFNILIRTLVHRAGAAGGGAARRADAATFHVGGGITWRSDPDAEERETRMKGAALAATLAGVDQPVDTLGAYLAHPAIGEEP